MKIKAKLFVLGIVVGGLLAFPFGFNIGRGAPLLSNPFSQVDLKDEVVERVKTGTTMALEDARETIHDATRPPGEAR